MKNKNVRIPNLLDLVKICSFLTDISFIGCPVVALPPILPIHPTPVIFIYNLRTKTEEQNMSNQNDGKLCL